MSEHELGCEEIYGIKDTDAKEYDESFREKGRGLKRYASQVKKKVTEKRLRTDGVTEGSSSEDTYIGYSLQETQLIHSIETLYIPAPTKEIEWTRCINEKRAWHALKLLKGGTWPSKDVLVDIFHAFPHARKEIFKPIASKITSLNMNIKETIPFYKIQDSRTNIVFIAELNDDEKIEIEFNGYNIEQRGRYQRSAENDRVHKEEANMEQSDFEEIENCMREHQVNLMETHTNLMMISPSSVKSVGFMEGDIQNTPLQKIPCIVFYVQYKGYIPIDETPFPKFLDNIPTDVREGCAVLQKYSPSDFIKESRIGSVISNNSGDTGTLSCFLENDGEVFALTCLHNMMDMNKYNDLILKGGREDTFSHSKYCTVNHHWYRGLLSSGECSCELACFQPNIENCFRSKPRLGVLTSALYKKGDARLSGVEVAIIKLRKDRYPTSGKFPDKHVNWCDLNEGTPRLTYASGSFIDVHALKSGTKVFKIGGSADLTTGKVGDRLTTIRLEFGILFNCISIPWAVSKDSNTTVPFSLSGDSGALVFAYNDSTTSDNLSAIGLVVGSAPAKNPTKTIVTPLSEIMREIGPDYTMKVFKS